MARIERLRWSLPPAPDRLAEGGRSAAEQFDQFLAGQHIGAAVFPVQLQQAVVAVAAPMDEVVAAGTHRYGATPYGWKVARFFARLDARVFRPALVALDPKKRRCAATSPCASLGQSRCRDRRLGPNRIPPQQERVRVILRMVSENSACFAE